MNLADVLKQVVWRLITEEQVSYHSIVGEFGFDDEALNDLRIFLIQTKGCAIDRNGRFLVWKNGAGANAVPDENTELPPFQNLSRVGALRAEASHRAPPAASATAGEAAAAERRQLTVMFCDLVDSTGLSSRLDPEDMAEVIRAYHDTARAIISEFDGFVAKFMGDGLVYFDFPKALERDAARAVRAALALVDAMPSLNAGLANRHDVRLAVRIGVATGVVMVGEHIGSDGAGEKAVVGETPNLAARLQGLAGANGIVISGTTRMLCGDEFTYSDLGPQELKGFAEPVAAWNVAGIAETALEPEGDSLDTPALVGRNEEIGLLRRAWQQSCDEKRGQVVTISGEPGIGKSSLLRLLRHEVRQQGFQRITMLCSQYHTNSALYPVIEHMKRAAGWQNGDVADTRLEKLERLLQKYSLPTSETVPLVARLMGLQVPLERYAALELTPEQLKEQTADVLVALTLEEAEQQPLLYVYEDLHWADPSTLEIIGQVIEQMPSVPLLMLLTFRPEFVPPWPNRSHITPLTLSRLEKPQIENLTRQLASGKELPTEVLDYVVRKTDGVPLYVEELTKTVLASGILVEEADRYVMTGPHSSLSIPASLQEVLMARLDRLPMVRDVAQLGAVFGREFAYEMVQSIQVFEEAKLRDGLDQLVDSELLYQRGRPPRATYTFKHALIQDAAYHSLLKRTRQNYHRQVATLLEKRFPDLVESQPELLAHHCTESGETARAIHYLQKAGIQAAQRSANLEVVAHASRAISQLGTLPDTQERCSTELFLQRLLGNALMATRGYAAVEAGDAFRRAHQLCALTSTDEDVCPVLNGVWLFELTRANHKVGREIAGEILARGSKTGDVEAELVGHAAAGISDLYRGAAELAAPHFSAVVSLSRQHNYQSLAYRYGVGLHVTGHCYAAWCNWILGAPEAARRLSRGAIAALENQKHLYTTARSLYLDSVYHQLCGEWPTVLQRAEEAGKVSREQGFALVVASSRILSGAAHNASGNSEFGIREMRQGLEDYRATGSRFQLPYFLALLADGLGSSGRGDEALAALDEALALAEQTGERLYEAEINRSRAALLLKTSRGATPEAVRHLVTALEVAKSQKANTFALKAAHDLAVLLVDGGDRRKARDVLASAYGTFTEGFDSPTLASARVLLDALE